jgi:hypothetical protein
MEGKSRLNEIRLPQFITVKLVLPAKACLELDPSVCRARATASAALTEAAEPPAIDVDWPNRPDAMFPTGVPRFTVLNKLLKLIPRFRLYGLRVFVPPNIPPPPPPPPPATATTAAAPTASAAATTAATGSSDGVAPAALTACLGHGRSRLDRFSKSESLAESKDSPRSNSDFHRKFLGMIAFGSSPATSQYERVDPHGTSAASSPKVGRSVNTASPFVATLCDIESGGPSWR